MAERLRRRNSIVTRYKRIFRRLVYIDMDNVQFYLRHVAVLFSTKRYCPGCGGKNIRRSFRRGFLDFCIMPLFLQRPFRCERCANRFYGLFFAVRTENKLSGENPQEDPSKP